MTDKINVTYLYKGFTKHHPEFLPEHQGSGFTGDFTDEDIELVPIAYFFNDNIAEKTRIALNHELADQDIEDDEEEFLVEEFGHDEFFGYDDYEDAQKYIDLNIQSLKKCSFQNDVEVDFESWEKVRDVGMQLLWFYHINNKHKKEEF